MVGLITTVTVAPCRPALTHIDAFSLFYSYFCTQYDREHHIHLC